MAIGFTINSLEVLNVQKQLHWSLWKTEGDKKLMVKSWSPSTAMHSPIWLLMACQQQEFSNASIKMKHVLSSVTSGIISAIMFASPIAYAIAVLFVFASSHCPPPPLSPTELLVQSPQPLTTVSVPHYLWSHQLLTTATLTNILPVWPIHCHVPWVSQCVHCLIL